MTGSPMLYKMPHFRSSKILRTRVFWRLCNQTLDGHISGLKKDRDNLKPLLRTKSPIPYRLVPLPRRSRDHTTSGLAFLVSRSSKTVDKAVMVISPVVEKRGQGVWEFHSHVYLHALNKSTSNIRTPNDSVHNRVEWWCWGSPSTR